MGIRRSNITGLKISMLKKKILYTIFQVWLSIFVNFPLKIHRLETSFLFLMGREMLCICSTTVATALK